MEPEVNASEKDDAFDLEATIAEFLCDEARTSIELPSTLSAEQRKLARRLADQHPELKCQSYGIGVERQLHLFKKVVGRGGAHSSIGVIGQDRPADQGSAVRVKNTFIDGWEGDSKTEEQLICRSTPVGSSIVEQTIQRCKMEGTLELAPVVEGGQKNISRVEEPTGSSSPVASSSGQEPGQIGSSPGSEAGSRGQELPSLPEGVKVSMRNTFIHIESVPDVERNTQSMSMPHGMFGRRIASELANQQDLVSKGGVDDVPESPRDRYDTLEGPLLEGPLLAPATGPLLSGPLLSTTLVPSPTPSAPLTAAPHWPPPPLPSEGRGQQIALGTDVIIQGLVKAPDFNGRAGVVQSFDYDTGRYNIHLNVPVGSAGHRWVKVKADNILVQGPPPPPQNFPNVVREGSSNLSASAPEFRPAASVTATTPVVRQQESTIPEEASITQSEKEVASEQSSDPGVKPLALNALV